MSGPSHLQDAFESEELSRVGPSEPPVAGDVTVHYLHPPALFGGPAAKVLGPFLSETQVMAMTRMVPR